MNSSHKVKELAGLPPPSPAIGGLAPNTVLRSQPFRATLAQQDRVPATSRRTVAEYGLDGSDTWHVPPGDDDPGITAPVGAQVYPEESTWRTTTTQPIRLTPGCMLEAHVLFVPAGNVQEQVGPNWQSAGNWGRVRVGVTWTSADGLSTTGPHYFGFEMAGGELGDYGGHENTDDGADWMELDERLIENIRPPDFTEDPDVAADYSEWTEAVVTIELLGAPRISHMAVYEVPFAHVTEHDDGGEVSVHAVPPGSGLLTARPMETAHDGATYEEWRFGTLRMMQVAQRQAERLGPHVLCFTSWDEDESNIWGATEASPIDITQTSFRDIFDSTNTSYDAENPGWIVAGSHAQLHRLCDPNLIMRGEAAVVPVRVRVDAGKSGAGIATVRIQSGAYEWIDIDIASGARTVYEKFGLLESQVHADHVAALCQVFGRVASAGTLSLYNVSVQFGAW